MQPRRTIFNAPGATSIDAPGPGDDARPAKRKTAFHLAQANDTMRTLEMRVGEFQGICIDVVPRRHLLIC